MAKFFGVGRTFRKGRGGIPARMEDRELIRDSLFMLLTTGIRERVMRPAFGSRLQDLVFESQGVVLNALIKREVRRLLTSFEPRVELLSINTTEDDTLLLVDIRYKVLGVEDQVQVPLEGRLNG